MVKSFPGGENIPVQTVWDGNKDRHSTASAGSRQPQKGDQMGLEMKAFSSA